MKFLKKVNNLYIGFAILCCLSLVSCEAGLTYDEAPESIYSEVGVNSGTPFIVRARELFPNQVWAKNWNKYAENYMNTQQISWEATLSEESNENAPGGILYVIHVKANTRVTYKTQNKGYLFDGNKFSGDFRLGEEDTDNAGMSQRINLPVRTNEVIGELILSDVYNCVVERVDGAPELGVPADFTKASRYLVKNICYRPAGVPQATRLYEVRITFVDQPEE